MGIFRMRSRFAIAVFGSTGKRLLCVALLSLVTLGCGDGNEIGRLPVSGKVTWNGKPLKTGYILFRQDGAGASSGSSIVDGSFELPVNRGITVGKYKVEITSEQETEEKIELDPADWGNERQGEMVHVTKQIIPPRYNTETELHLTVEGPPVTVSYDLTEN